MKKVSTLRSSWGFSCHVLVQTSRITRVWNSPDRLGWLIYSNLCGEIYSLRKILSGQIKSWVRKVNLIAQPQPASNKEGSIITLMRVRSFVLQLSKLKITCDRYQTDNRQFSWYKRKIKWRQKLKLELICQRKQRTDFYNVGKFNYEWNWELTEKFVYFKNSEYVSILT